MSPAKILKCWSLVLALVYPSNSTDILSTAVDLPRLTGYGPESSCDEVPRIRKKRSFGGKEAINFTQVNTNALGPPGFVSISSGAVLDFTFYVSGYIVLGRSLQTRWDRIYHWIAFLLFSQWSWLLMSVLPNFCRLDFAEINHGIVGY